MWGKGQGKSWGDGQGKSGQGKSGGKQAMMQMFQWMMQMKGGKGGGKGSWGQAAAASGGSCRNFAWKSELVKAFSKTCKEPPTKTTFIYTTTKDGDSFSCSVASEKFAIDHSGEGDTEKAAVEAAAEAALRAEFPDYVEQAEKFEANCEQQAKATKASSKADGGPEGFEPWRSQLGHAYAKKHKVVVKDSIKYETEKIGEKPAQYQSTVSSENFASSYTGEPSLSMPFSKDSAAMIAMETEFPEEYARSRAPKTLKSFKKAKKKHNAEMGGKRKEKGGDQDIDPKSRLNNAMSLLSPQPITKESIAYTTVVQGGSTIATVTINCFGESQTFTGEAVPGTRAANKKPAESSAAEAAYDHFSDQIASAEEENKEKKKERDEKKRTEWKLMLERKKEEGALKKANKEKE